MICFWEFVRSRLGTYDVCVFITAVPVIKLFAWGEGDSGGSGHVPQETTSRGLCGLVCPFAVPAQPPLAPSERFVSFARGEGQRPGKKNLRMFSRASDCFVTQR
jgi:hypothetical protein